MSEHKTGSRLSEEDRVLYRERRNRGLRGQLSAATVFQAVKDEDGKEHLIPIGNKAGRTLSRSKSSDRRKYQRQQTRAAIRQQRKASQRGA